MDLLLGSFVGVLLGVFFTIVIIRWLAFRLIQHLANAVANTDQQVKKVKQIRLKIEFDQNNYFMYNVADGSFVVQGETIEQIRERLSLRYPDYDATVVEGDPDVMAKLRKEIELTLDENSNSIRSAP